MDPTQQNPNKEQKSQPTISLFGNQGKSTGGQQSTSPNIFTGGGLFNVHNTGGQPPQPTQGGQPALFGGVAFNSQGSQKPGGNLGFGTQGLFGNKAPTNPQTAKTPTSSQPSNPIFDNQLFSNQPKSQPPQADSSSTSQPKPNIIFGNANTNPSPSNDKKPMFSLDKQQKDQLFGGGNIFNKGDNAGKSPFAGFGNQAGDKSEGSQISIFGKKEEGDTGKTSSPLFGNTTKPIFPSAPKQQPTQNQSQAKKSFSFGQKIQDSQKLPAKTNPEDNLKNPEKKQQPQKIIFGQSSSSGGSSIFSNQNKSQLPFMASGNLFGNQSNQQKQGQGTAKQQEEIQSPTFKIPDRSQKQNKQQKKSQAKQQSSSIFGIINLNKQSKPQSVSSQSSNPAPSQSQSQPSQKISLFGGKLADSSSGNIFGNVSSDNSKSGGFSLQAGSLFGNSKKDGADNQGAASRSESGSGSSININSNNNQVNPSQKSNQSPSSIFSNNLFPSSSQQKPLNVFTNTTTPNQSSSQQNSNQNAMSNQLPSIPEKTNEQLNESGEVQAPALQQKGEKMGIFSLGGNINTNLGANKDNKDKSSGSGSSHNVNSNKNSNNQSNTGGSALASIIPNQPQPQPQTNNQPQLPQFGQQITYTNNPLLPAFSSVNQLNRGSNNSNMFGNSGIDLSRPPHPQRDRTPTFDQKGQSVSYLSVNSNSNLSNQGSFRRTSSLKNNRPLNPQDYFTLTQLLQQLSRPNTLPSFLQQNLPKIESTMLKYLPTQVQTSANQFNPNSTHIPTSSNLTFANPSQSQPQSQPAQQLYVYQPISFIPELNPDQGINRLLNDFTYVIARLYRIPQSSYQAYGRTFYDMLAEGGLLGAMMGGDQGVRGFSQYKLNQQYVIRNRIYAAYSDNNIVFQPNQKHPVFLVTRFITYFSNQLTKCLTKLQPTPSQPIFKQANILYQLLLDKCVKIKYRVPVIYADNIQVMEAMSWSDEKESAVLEGILGMVIRLDWGRNDLISEEKILDIMPLVDKLPISQCTTLYQNLLLKKYPFSQPATIPRSFITAIESTQSPVLLPFRAILFRLDRIKSPISPKYKQLLSQIKGHQWVDWFCLYLGDDNAGVNVLDEGILEEFVAVLDRLKIADVGVAVGRKSGIARFLRVMRQQGQIGLFYESLSHLIYDKSSLKTIQQQYLSQKDGTLQASQLRQLGRYFQKHPDQPVHSYAQTLPQLYGKAVYLLTSLSVDPQKAFYYQNALYDIMGFMDEESERCDRVCHLVLDLLGMGVDVGGVWGEVVAKAFGAVISMLGNLRTRDIMSVAMYINRPQLDQLNTNLPKSVTQKIYQFLAQLLQSPQFYNSTRATIQSQQLQKAYPFRYDIVKYLQILNASPQTYGYLQTQSRSQLNQSQPTTKTTIPLYWFSSCLKLITKQGYNPQLIQIMLSKLKIYAPKNGYSNSDGDSIPLVLSAIVDGCNNSGFYKEFVKVLKGVVLHSRTGISICNKFLMDDLSQNSTTVIFYSLRLLRTMLHLRNIRNHGQKHSPRHFTTQLLTPLLCLNELDRQYLHTSAQLDLFSNTNLSPIISLLSLIFIQSRPINSSASFKTQWLYEDSGVNLEYWRRLHGRYGEIVDYGVLREPLKHPLTADLLCYEDVADLVFQCLNIVLSESTDVAIETLLYMSVPKNKNAIQDFNQLKKSIIQRFARHLQLQSPTPHKPSSSSPWSLLLTLRLNPMNSKLSQQIFSTYSQTHKKQSQSYQPHFLQTINLSQKISSYKSILTFLKFEVRDSNFAYTDMIEDVLMVLGGGYSRGFEAGLAVQVGGFGDQLDEYESRVGAGLSLEEFQRLVRERNLLSMIDYYQSIGILTEIVLNQLYSNTNASENASFLYSSIVTRHSSLLFKIIAQSKILTVYPQPLPPVPASLPLSPLPRLTNTDILQLFISNPSTTRKQLLLIQVQNVKIYLLSKLSALNRQIFVFLSVILSIDRTYYANHPIKLRSFGGETGYIGAGRVEMLCQMHLGVVHCGLRELIGRNDKEGLISVKMIIDSCLEKIQKCKMVGFSANNNNILQGIANSINFSQDLAINQSLIGASNSQNDQLQQTYQLLDQLMNILKTINSTPNTATLNPIVPTLSVPSSSNPAQNNRLSRKTQTIHYCRKIISTCFAKLGEPITEPYTAKLLLTCMKILYDDGGGNSNLEIDHEFTTNIKQTILKTLSHCFQPSVIISPPNTANPVNTLNIQPSQIRQYLLSLLLILPHSQSYSAPQMSPFQSFPFPQLTPTIPQPLASLPYTPTLQPQTISQTLLQKLLTLWCNQSNPEYFYNQSRILYTLCEQHPIQVVKYKPLTKCTSIVKYQESALQGARYQNGIRSVESKSWLWILKIVTVLIENGRDAILVVNQVGRFVSNCVGRLKFTLNQSRDSINMPSRSSSRTNQKQNELTLNLAQLDQLQATLQLFIALSQSKMWVQMNRQLFEQLLYYLMHKTIILFAPSSVGQRIRKIYKQVSINEQVLTNIYPKQFGVVGGMGRDNLSMSQDGSKAASSIDYQYDEIAELIDQNRRRSDIFRFAMSFRFNQCLKLWLLACSSGMRNSCFVRQYFNKPINSSPNNPLTPINSRLYQSLAISPSIKFPTSTPSSVLRYSLTHWDHLNRAIIDIINYLIRKVTTWGKLEDRNQVLDLIYDCFTSAEMFMETGYLYSMVRFPESKEELISELGETLGFALEMGACHLVSQIYFRNKNGAFSKQNLQGFQEKLLKLQTLASQKLLSNKVSKEDLVFQHIKAAQQLVYDIKI